MRSVETEMRWRATKFLRDRKGKSKRRWRGRCHPRDAPYLGRVTESVPTPVETDIQSTIFQVHKVQAIVDPLTNKELQWGALKATILGTYYDANGEIGFGNDVEGLSLCVRDHKML
jgi:hypothetical protein